MIPRYSREKMTRIWSPENRYQKWLDVEIWACEAMVKLGKIPPSALKNIKEKVSIDVKRIDEIEKTTKHDVIAFLTSLTEKVGEDGRFIHMGLTSSDILDTSLAVLLKEAAQILLEDIDELTDLVEEAVLGGAGGQASVAEAVEPAAVCSDPKIVRAVFIDAQDMTVGQAAGVSRLGLVDRETMPVVPVQIILRADPEKSLVILKDAIH